MSDWQPEQYLKFRNERTQPAIDLVNRIDMEAPKRIIDIGCGPGNSTAILKARWPDAHIYGLDSSSAMIERAKNEYPDITWLFMDSSDNLSELGKFDVIFSNAALQWMPDHEKLIPKLYNMLCNDGVFAVQVPCAKHLPVYSEMQKITRLPKWTKYYADPPVYPKHFTYYHYYDIIGKLTKNIQIWQTDYIHIMSSHDMIVEWYKGSGLRPFLDLLPDDSLKAEFCDEYLANISQSYKIERNGSVLLKFTRIFFMLHK